MHADVVIVEAGPTGLMLAGELVRAGVRPTVLGAHPECPTMPEADGTIRRVAQVLHHRGLLEGITGDLGPPPPTSSFRFDARTPDLSTVDDNALYVLPSSRRRLEEVPGAHVGVEVRRGHEVVDLVQHHGVVELRVSSPGGGHRMPARYVVGADGGRSVVRKRAGIGFVEAGPTHRTGQVVLHERASHVGGRLSLPGLGVLFPSTYHHTGRDVLAFGAFQPKLYRIALIESGGPGLADTDAMTLEELRGAAKRVLGVELPMSEPPPARPPPLHRRAEGLGSRPGPGPKSVPGPRPRSEPRSGLGRGLGRPRPRCRATPVAPRLCRSARPVLLDFAGRAELRAVTGPWLDRVDVHTATTPAPPADAVLVRPDGYVAWAGGPSDELEGALRRWFGEPR